MTKEYKLCVEKRFLQDGLIPLFLLYDRQETAKKVVLSLHGGSHSKESILTMYPEGAELAKRGYLVASFDSFAHGERSQQEDTSWQEIAMRTACEVPSVVDYLLSREDILGDSVAIIGGSMGGVATYLSLLLEHRIAAAVMGISSPVKLEQPAPEIADPLGGRTFAQVQDYLPLGELLEGSPPAILVQLGNQDGGFSPASAEEYVKMLSPYYAKCPDKLRLNIVEGLGHDTTPEMADEVVAWIETFF